jgi:phenol 2-monooxygenase
MTMSLLACRWGHGTLQQGVVEEIMKKKITEVCGVEVEYETTLFELSLDTTKANDPEAFPWSATVRYGTDEPPGQMPSKTMLAKYVVGADGGRSFVRQTMGIEMQGTKGEAVWGVMDIIGTSDFPE